MANEFAWRTPHLESKELTKTNPAHDHGAMELFAWWSTQSSCPPNRRDFDIVEHRHLAARIFLFEFLDNNMIRYRLHGDAITFLAGKKNADLAFNEQDNDPHFAELARYLSFIKKQQKPFVTRGRLDIFDKKHIPFESIDLPLFGQNGQIQFILGTMSTAIV